nr:transposase (putative), gypsy type [Tanacetum cinerariifolium]
MVRDSVQLETAVNTITHEYLLEFTSEYGISEMLRLELPGPRDRIVDFPEGKTNTSKDGMPASGTYSVEAVRVLDTHRTPIQKQPEALLCLFGISRRYYLGDDVDGSIQLNTCSQSNKERSPLDFAKAEASGRETAAPEMPAPEEYNVNLARQVAMGSQLQLRFEQEAKLLKKSVAQVARRDKRIQDRELEIKNLKALLETEAEMKRATEVSNEHLSQRVAALQEQVSGEEKLKAAFEEFKRYKDDRVEQRCAELDARLDALSIDFDEERYPHMLTAIAGRRWVIGHGLRLAMMKCAESLEMRQAFVDVVSPGVAKGMSEGLKHGVEHGRSQLELESIKAYDPEAEAKFVAALESLKDLKFSLLDQLEGLKDAPMDVIMAPLYLESDTEGMPHNTYAISAPAPHS